MQLAMPANESKKRKEKKRKIKGQSEHNHLYVYICTKVKLYTDLCLDIQYLSTCGWKCKLAVAYIIQSSSKCIFSANRCSSSNQGDEEC